jgi:hypothetical protein
MTFPAYNKLLAFPIKEFHFFSPPPPINFIFQTRHVLLLPEIFLAFSPPGWLSWDVLFKTKYPFKLFTHLSTGKMSWEL